MLNLWQLLIFCSPHMSNSRVHKVVLAIYRSNIDARQKPDIYHSKQVTLQIPHHRTSHKLPPSRKSIFCTAPKGQHCSPRSNHVFNAKPSKRYQNCDFSKQTAIALLERYQSSNSACTSAFLDLRINRNTVFFSH